VNLGEIRDHQQPLSHSESDSPTEFRFLSFPRPSNVFSGSCLSLLYSDDLVYRYKKKCLFPVSGLLVWELSVAGQRLGLV
jgi:hypothetical protein